MAPAISPASGKRDPEADAFQGQDRDGIGADGVEADMAERDLPGKSDQDIQSDADDGGERHHRQHERRIASGFRGIQRRAAREQQHRDRHRKTAQSGIDLHRQTLLIAARPNRPLGISASARITTENTTIWV